MAIVIRLSRNKIIPQKPRGQAQNCALVILFMLIKSLDFYSMKEFLQLPKIVLWVFLLIEAQELMEGSEHLPQRSQRWKQNL